MNKFKIYINNKVAFRLSMFFIIMFVGFISYGQKNLTLDQAVEIAKKNNHQLKSDKMVIAYKELMIKTANDFDPTNFTSEIGQVNSSFFDTRFGVSQSFMLPKVYRQKKEVLKSDRDASFLRLSLSESEIKQRLDRLYLEFDFVSEKTDILIFQDSLYKEFLDRAISRLKSGESNILEKNLAEIQKSNISLQIEQLKTEKEVILLEFNLLVNDEVTHYPMSRKLELLKYNVFSDSAKLYNHPILKLDQQNINSARSISMLAKSALLPSFSVGYANMSIRGTGADDINYTAKTRFSSVQIGAAIPILTKSIKANIEASKVNETILEIQLAKDYSAISNSIDQQESRYNYYLKLIDYYNNNGLTNAQVIRNTAALQYGSGEINYMDYVLMLNQTLSMEIQYVEAIKAANDIAITLFYLTNNY